MVLGTYIGTHAVRGTKSLKSVQTVYKMELHIRTWAEIKQINLGS